MKGSRQRELFSIQALQFFDCALIVFSFWVGGIIAPLLRPLFGLSIGQSVDLGNLSSLLFILVPFTPLVLEGFGFYRRLFTKDISKSFGELFSGLLVMGAIVTILLFVFKMTESSRLVIGISFFLMLCLLLLRDSLMRSHYRKQASNNEKKERIILAGFTEDMESFLHEIPSSLSDYWHIVARFALDKEKDVNAIDQLFIQHSVRRVIIASRNTPFQKISQVVELCEQQGIEAWISAGFIRTQLSRATFDTLGHKPMLVLRSTPDLSIELLAKSLLDRSIALLFILLSSPCWIFAMIGIYFSDKGPVFFRQDRAGRYGKPFKMWKFRTMCVDAEAKLASIKETQGNEMSGPVFKLQNDPRVFPFARFLRKWSIDEFPQMINVLTGDMSLVGPRPLPVYEVEEFKKSAHRRRLSVKPGITCTWQAGGRNTITEWEDWVKMDLHYIDNWSFWLDIKILLLTVPAVLFGKGAK